MMFDHVIVSRLTDEDISDEEMELSVPGSPSSPIDHHGIEDREKTEEEKANWMSEYAPFFESMYDHIKRKRAASAKASQNLSRSAGKKRRLAVNSGILVQ